MIIYILFIAHFLADFTFQSAKLAKEKLYNFKHFIYHIIIHAVIFSLAIFPFLKFGGAIFVYILILASHFLIDFIRNIVDRKANNKTVIFASFIVDQLLHISVLIVLYFVFIRGAETTALYDGIKQWLGYKKLAVYALIFVTL